MKRLFVLIFTFAMPLAHVSAAQGHARKDVNYFVLVIRYIGESDVPVPTIVISDSEAGAEWYRTAVLKRGKLFTPEHVVSVALLEKLIAESETFEGSVRQEQEKLSETSKTVSVTIVTPRKNNTFYYDPNSFTSQLDTLQKLCEGDESLRANLLKFQDRIRP